MDVKEFGWNSKWSIKGQVVKIFKNVKPEKKSKFFFFDIFLFIYVFGVWTYVERWKKNIEAAPL